MLEAKEVVLRDNELKQLSKELLNIVEPMFITLNNVIPIKELVGINELGYSNLLSLEEDTIKLINEVVSNLFKLVSPVIVRDGKVVRNIKEEDILLGDELVWVAKTNNCEVIINVSNNESKYDSIHYKDSHLVKGSKTISQVVEVVGNSLITTYLVEEEDKEYPNIEGLCREQNLNYIKGKYQLED